MIQCDYVSAKVEKIQDNKISFVVVDKKANQYQNVYEWKCEKNESFTKGEVVTLKMFDYENMNPTDDTIQKIIKK